MSTTEPDVKSAPSREPLPPSRTDAGLNEDLVAAWIFENPEIISQNNRLLMTLDPPARYGQDTSGKVVDLQQAMIRKLQAEADRQAKFGRALIQAGESNQDAQARVHRAVLMLIEARGFDMFLERLTGPVAQALNLCAVAVGVEAPEGRRPPASLKAVAALSPGSVDRLIGADHPARLRADIDRTQGQPPGPFGPRAKEIRSDALIRLHLGRGLAPALLALGSTAPDMFRPDQGVDLVIFLGGVVERLIGQWLDLPTT